MFDTLPNEILNIIFGALPLRDIKAFSCVDKSSYALIIDLYGDSIRPDAAVVKYKLQLIRYINMNVVSKYRGNTHSVYIGTHSKFSYYPATSSRVVMSNDIIRTLGIFKCRMKSSTMYVVGHKINHLY